MLIRLLRMYLFDVVKVPWLSCHLIHNISDNNWSMSQSVLSEEFLVAQIIGTPSFYLHVSIS